MSLEEHNTPESLFRGPLDQALAHVERRREEGGRLEGGVSEYISQDPGLVVLPPGLSSSAFKKLEIGTFKRQNERVEGHVCVGRHRNGKILATDPMSFGVFSVFLLFDAHTARICRREACGSVCVCVCVCPSVCVCVNLFLCRQITLCCVSVSVSRNP